MSGVVVNNKTVVLNGVIGLLELMEDLAQAEMSRHAHGVKFYAVAEILFGLVEVARVCKLCGQMNTSAKVALVVQQTLLEMVNRLLKLLELLKLAPNMEMSLQVALLFHIVGVVN